MDRTGRRVSASAPGTGQPTVKLTDRGQTTIDFAVGASILLLCASFVIAVAPNLFFPTPQGSASDPLTSDRIADHLVAAELSDDSSIEAFFSDSGAIELGPPAGSVNVSIHSQKNGAPAAIDGSTNTTAERGQPVPDTAASAQPARTERVVSYDGERHWLVVRAW